MKKEVDITERGFQFARRIVQLVRRLRSDPVGRVLGAQLLRCGTSIGANLWEAQGGQTRADFTAKLSIAHKEALECAFWLRLLTEEGFIEPGEAAPLQDETDQIIRILSSILINVKRIRK